MHIDYLFIIKSSMDTRGGTYLSDLASATHAQPAGAVADINKPQEIVNFINGSGVAGKQTVRFVSKDWDDNIPNATAAGAVARGVIGIVRIEGIDADELNLQTKLFFDKIRKRVAQMNGIDQNLIDAYQVRQENLLEGKTPAIWGAQPLSSVIECFEPAYSNDMDLHLNAPNRYNIYGFVGGLGGKH